MRDFNEADREKKTRRIKLQENPGNLSKEVLSQLEGRVKTSLKDGYLPCSVAWEIAGEAGVSKITIGEITDRLEIRITNCQVGCFKVEKTPYDGSAREITDSEFITTLETLKENDKLTCAKVFELVEQFKLKPMAIANYANDQGLRIHICQLGCF